MIKLIVRETQSHSRRSIHNGKKLKESYGSTHHCVEKEFSIPEYVFQNRIPILASMKLFCPSSLSDHSSSLNYSPSQTTQLYYDVYEECLIMEHGQTLFYTLDDDTDAAISKWVAQRKEQGWKYTTFDEFPNDGLNLRA